MNWPWSKRDYSEGAAKFTSGDISRHLAAGLSPDGVEQNDLIYTGLREKDLKDFTFKYHDNVGQYKSEFPDCDDFAVCAWGDMLRGAIRQGFRFAPAFGFIKLQRPGMEYHAMNFAVTAEGKVLLFEPQTGKWSDDVELVSDAYCYL